MSAHERAGGPAGRGGTMLRTKSAGVLVAAAMAVLTPLATPASAAGHVSPPLLTGLAGPLGLAVGTDGTVYVAQSFPDATGVSRLTTLSKKGVARTLVTVADGEVAGLDA